MTGHDRRQRFRIGQRAIATNFALVVRQVHECEPKYYFSKPGKGHVWIGAEVLVESISDRQIWANPASAKLVDADGTTYNYSYASTTNCDPGLRAIQLTQGQKASGWIVFELPENRQAAALIYDLNLFEAPEKLEFDLGR
jgi:hypothetical protein